MAPTEASAHSCGSSIGETLAVVTGHTCFLLCMVPTGPWPAVLSVLVFAGERTDPFIPSSVPSAVWGASSLAPGLGDVAVSAGDRNRGSPFGANVLLERQNVGDNSSNTLERRKPSVVIVSQVL